MLIKLILLICVFLQRVCNGERVIDIVDGAYLDIADLPPNISFIETINLYSNDVNILYNVYQRRYNDTLTETFKVLTGNTTINSANRCIDYGYSFYNWGEIPIKYSDKKVNGGCDALWGDECSQNILLRIRQTSLHDINSRFCGIDTPVIFSNPPSNCLVKDLSHTQLSLMEFFHNDTFMQGIIPPIMNVSRPWVYFKSSHSIDGNYNELMKYFDFTYFIGREYTSDNIDVGISCFSIYNTTILSSSITQLYIFLSFFVILVKFIS